MFKLCTILSLVCDVLIVTFFVVHPHLVEDKPSKDIEALFAIEHSFFPFILLAITRILCLIAFVQLYAVSAQLRNIHILYFWMSIHVVLSAITLIFMNYHDEFMIAKRLLVFASFVSIACQVVCIRHLRSSVLSIHCVALGLSDKLRNALKSQHHIYTESPDFNDDDEVKGNKLQGSSSTSFDIESSFSTPTKQRRVQRSLNNNRLLTSLRKKIKSANDAWNRQVFNLRRNISKGFTIIPTNRRNKRHHHDPLTSSQNIFQHILTLYIGESVSVQQQALAQLMEIFKSHPSLLEFYIPHIITYLLYGSFSIEELLMQRILYMCRMQLSFAIRMQWYVEAFILSNAQSIDGMDTLNELIREIASAGNEAYRRLEAVQEKDRQGYGSISDSHLIAGGEWKENWDVEMGPFSAETTFWLDLVDITKKIVHVPVAFRNVELRKLLQCEHFANTLQQQIIVLPWTSTTTKYRICHIHVEESFAFRTNERAPSLICLEVIPLHLPTTQLSERYVMLLSIHRWIELYLICCHIVQIGGLSAVSVACCF